MSTQQGDLTAAVSEVIDIQVTREGGSLFLFYPLTDLGRSWLDENIYNGGSPEDVTTFGNALVVEHRYALDLAEGMINDGLVVR